MPNFFSLCLHSSLHAHILLLRPLPLSPSAFLLSPSAFLLPLTLLSAPTSFFFLPYPSLHSNDTLVDILLSASDPESTHPPKPTTAAHAQRVRCPEVPRAPPCDAIGTGRKHENGVPEPSAGVPADPACHPGLHHRLRAHHRRRGRVCKGAARSGFGRPLCFHGAGRQRRRELGDDPVARAGRRGSGEQVSERAPALQGWAGPEPWRQMWVAWCTGIRLGQRAYVFVSRAGLQDVTLANAARNSGVWRVLVGERIWKWRCFGFLRHAWECTSYPAWELEHRSVPRLCRTCHRLEQLKFRNGQHYGGPESLILSFSPDTTVCSIFCPRFRFPTSTMFLFPCIVMQIAESGHHLSIWIFPLF